MWAVTPPSGSFIGELANWGVEQSTQMSALRATYNDPDSYVKLQAYGNGADVSYSTGLSRADASSLWYMYTLVYYSSGIQFYRDNTYLGSVTPSTSWNTPSTVRLNLGGTGNDTMTNFFKGYIAQVCTVLFA